MYVGLELVNVEWFREEATYVLGAFFPQAIFPRHQASRVPSGRLLLFLGASVCIQQATGTPVTCRKYTLDTRETRSSVRTEDSAPTEDVTSCLPTLPPWMSLLDLSYSCLNIR